MTPCSVNGCIYNNHCVQERDETASNIHSSAVWHCDSGNIHITTALTHGSDLVQRPVLLPRLIPGNKIPQTDGAQRDETEVDTIQKRPGHLHCAEHGRRCHKEAQNHQNQQQQEVDDGGWPKLHA